MCIGVVVVLAILVAVTVAGSVIIFTSSPVSSGGQQQQETTTFPHVPSLTTNSVTYKPDARETPRTLGATTGLSVTSASTTVQLLNNETNMTTPTVRTTVEGINQEPGEIEKITFGGIGDEPGKFLRPHGVFVSENNDIYVADSGNRRVQVHDMSGTHLHLFPTVVPRTHGKKMMPYDVAIDGDNMIWVLGKTRSFGEYLIQYTTGGHPMLKLLVGFHTNLGIAINYQRKLIIVTEILEGSGQVKILRPDGSLVTRFGEQQKMVNPGSVTVNREGNIFVSDYGTDHVYSFNGQGNFLFKFNANMPAELQGICTDISDHIVVTGTGNIAAIVFTSSGRYLRHVASTNRRYEGVAVGPHGQLVITSPSIHRVIIFPRY
ncbi:protein meiotic P26-like [Branchiostoma floridae x Branchiostoma japonicum]